MKKCLWLLILFLLCSVNVLWGQTTYVFTTSSSYSCPITIHVNGRVYRLTKAEPYANVGKAGATVTVTLYNNGVWEAYDSDNDRMTDYSRNVKYRDGIDPEERGTKTIEFVRIILKGSTKRSKHNNSNDTYSNQSKSNTNGLVEKASDVVASTYQSAFQSGMGIADKAFPYLSASVGYSRFASTFVELKYRTSGLCGVSLMGQYGFGKSPDDKVLWNIGFGVCIEHCGLNVRYGETALCLNQGISVDLSYDIFLFDHFGITPFIGCVIGDTKKKDPDTFFNWGASVIYKF